MELRHRDYEIIKLVGTFTQLASTHLEELLFADRSHSIPDTVLRRLVRLNYLARVGRRAPGDKGGASAYVYQLGRFGRALLDIEGRPSPTVSDHALMIADTYLELRRAEKLGVLSVKRWEVELPVPPVRADLFAVLDFPAQQRTSSFFLEIDLGTERPVRIVEKIAGYWRAAESSQEEYFPYVVFVVKQEARKAEMGRIIRKLPAAQREMVKVVLIGELIPQLMRL
ncbi:replication-relaxation family protein [Kitasatospora sp. NPDC088391]|uniref:replication-relaxation family protein n=1 Tax=Kitasatospora sp. NPDC088391 TaxID=3364074 RepID=UPI003802CFDB